MGSTRLPGKSLRPLAGLPLVTRVAQRALAATQIDRVVFALPLGPQDDPLATHVQEVLGLQVHRGSAEDVLARFADVVRAEQPSIVVRLTADDPLKDPAVIDMAISMLLADDSLDYVSNSLQSSYPEGLDVEVVRAVALLEADAEATLPFEREHVTPFIWQRPERYRLAHLIAPRDLGSWRWTLDNDDDFRFLEALLTAMPSSADWYAYEHVVEFLESKPDLLGMMPRQPRSVDKVRQQKGEQP
jgi:spore coat polysaccharide biosynthesis protein SpsF